MYVVGFRSRKRADIDQAAYDTVAEAMETAALSRPGDISFMGCVADDGEVVALSEWADEASARVWGRYAEHLSVQARGRAEWYAEYTLYGCPNPRTHRFQHRTQPDKDTQQ